jgi:hypothetical protein
MKQIVHTTSPSSSLQWRALSKTKLLDVKIRDLDLNIEQSPLQKSLEKIHQELEQKGFIFFRPQAYLGDEWFCPEGSTYISIPFYLADKTLSNLEYSITAEVEGGSIRSREKLIRHEAGHCFDHAYDLSTSHEWKKIFGDRNKKYTTENYQHNPLSNHYVQNLDNHYAQSHPLEDFAETFAIWLDPTSSWKQQYRYHPIALEKLNYINMLATKFSNKKPINLGGKRIFQANKLKSTLKQYYKRRSFHL